MKTKSLKKQLTAQFYHRNMLAFLVSTFAALASGSLGLLISWLMQQLVDTASGVHGSLSLLELTRASIGFLSLCIVLYILTCIVRPSYLKRAMQQYKNYAFEILIHKSISSFKDESTAAYLSSLTNDATSIESNYLSQQFDIITMSVTFIGALAMMLWYSPLLTAVAICVSILPLFASILTGGRLEAAEVRVSDHNKDFTAALQDCLGGFSIVKSFKAEKEIYDLFKGNNSSLEKEKCNRQRVKSIIGMIGSVTGIFAQLAVFLVGAYLTKNGYGLTPGALLLFVNLMNYIIEPIATLPSLLANRKAALGLVDKLANALEQNSGSTGGLNLSSLAKGIELQDVSFGYEKDKEILRHISVRFEAGKAYAIVGGSGCGKSTLLNLLMAASTDYSGSILFDDAELRSISAESLYDVISVIQQSVFVFNASIRDNVSMFRNFPDAELDEAIRRAHLECLFRERGEDYLCGENGKGLSGGEKQRISIARSLLKKSSVLLVDEATSSLDAQTAHQVSDNILDLTGVTRIVVTHALAESQMRRYDEIIVLKNGTVTEAGTFDSLMEKRGYFYALFTVAQ